MVIVVALGLVLGASAQRFGQWWRPEGRHMFTYCTARVSVGVRVSHYALTILLLYSPFGYNPYYGYNSRSYRPSKLDVQIADIKNDYQDKIWSAKHDTSLSGKERRKVVHQLRSERDQAVIDAKRNYYKY